jgi:CYTH domain-containing protein
MIYRILITGGPLAGKTTCSTTLKYKFINKVTIVPKVSTLLLKGFPENKDDSDWMCYFHKALIPAQYAIEEFLTKEAIKKRHKVIIMAGSVHDCLAYTKLTQQELIKEFNIKSISESYDMVILLDSISLHYIPLYDIYSSHPNFHYIKRTDDIKKKIDDLVKEKVYREIELKYLLLELPPNLNIVHTETITDCYIESLRIRKIKNGNNTRYYTCIKDNNTISRNEYETEISETEYMLFTEDRDIFLEKTRFYVPYDGLMLEFNVFHHPILEKIIIMECEFISLEELKKFIIPPYILKYVDGDVTDKKAFKNRNLYYTLVTYGLYNFVNI